MLSVQQSTWIQASPQTVFDVLDAPARQPSFTPSLVTSRELERLPNGGARARYVFRIRGIDFEGEVRATNYARPERIVWAMTGDLKGTIRWYLSPQNGGTHFTYAATYAVPGPTLMRPVLTPLLRRYNEAEVEALLQNLKALVEAEATPLS